MHDAPLPHAWRHLFRDTPFGEPHPLQDCLGEKQREPAIELRSQVQAEHFPRGPGNGPFGRLGVGQRVGVGHVPIEEQDENRAQATGGCGHCSKAGYRSSERR